MRMSSLGWAEAADWMVQTAQMAAMICLRYGLYMIEVFYSGKLRKMLGKGVNLSVIKT